MRSFKDYLYDKNDILLALGILIIAGLLIFWRMNVIMDYPKTLAAETGTTKTTEQSAVSNDKAGSDKSSAKVWDNGKLAKDMTVTVSGGSATSAVQILVDNGLFKSYSDFESVCKDAGCRPENIKAATFTFKAGSTPAEIAQQVTK